MTFVRPLAVALLLTVACGGSLPPVSSPEDDPAKRGPSAADARSTTWSDEESPVPVSSADPTWGSRAAPVTIVEFSDLECPFCARGAKTIEALEEAYGPDRLRVVWKNAPLSFHAHARRAAEAARGVFELAGPDAFWKFTKTVFEHQAEIGEERWGDWARASGVVDIGRFERGLAQGEWAQPVKHDMKLARDLGVTGTPTFFVNGIRLEGAWPRERLASIIDEQLAKAQARRDSGVPADRIYVTLSKESFEREADEEEEEDEDPTVWKVPTDGRPALGAKDALVTIVEFSDFQCPFCARVEPTLKRLLAKYPDEVRLVWRNQPLSFHPRAEPAAELALEARAQKGDAGFWDAHDRIFAAQSNLDDATLERIAADMRLDVSKVKAAIRTHKHRRVIEEDQGVADDFQANGTPHFFVNGRRVAGAQPFEVFEKVVLEEIALARALVAAGTAPSDVYEARTRNGSGPPPLETVTVSAPAGDAPAKGPASAVVTIQEFADFQCPFCKRAEDVLKRIEKEYAGRVRIVWRHLPLSFHADARRAARAAMEAKRQRGQRAFWQMHDLVFQNQASPDGLSKDALERYAKQLGLDVGQFEQGIEGTTHDAAIDADARAAKDAGISGTPTFVINGYRLVGAQPYVRFKKVIERALDDAKSSAARPAKRGTE